ncbi:MAG: polysaccharide biosynthesis tyrosine autokinase [Bacteroidota bacterium]
MTSPSPSEFNFTNDTAGLGGLTGGLNFDIEKVRITIRESIWVALAILILVNAGAFFYVRYTKPIYESSSTLKLEFKGNAQDLQLGIFRSDNDIKNYLSGEIAFIGSRNIAEKVIDSLDLHISYYQKGNITDDEKFPLTPFTIKNIKNISDGLRDQKIDIQFALDNKTYEVSYRIGDEKYQAIGEVGKEIMLPTGGQFQLIRNTEQTKQFNAESNYFFILHSDRAVLEYFQSHFIASVLNPNAQTIRTVFTDANRYKAATIIDVVNGIYLKQTLENKNLSYRQIRSELKQKLTAYSDSLEAYEDRIGRYRRENGIFEITDRETLVKQIMTELEELSQERVALQSKLRMAQQVERELEKDSVNFALVLSLAQVLENSVLTESLNILQERQESLEELKRVYTKNTVAYQERYRKFIEAQLAVSQIIQLGVSELENLIFLKVREINRTRARLPAESNAPDLELRRLQRYLDQYLSLANRTSEKFVDNDMAEAGTVPDFKVLSRASLPDTPIYPIPAQIYLYAFAFSIFLSAVWVVVRYLLQNKITNVAEMERLTKAPILGVVPTYREKIMEVSQLVVNEKAKSSISEAFRSIRTNLDFISLNNETKRIISVTSTISGEGKTFVALNLGGIIAQSNLKVILLDLDMRKPKVHRAFNQEASPGMSTLLTGRSSLEECIRLTGAENMDFIAAGAVPPNPSELILSPQFDKLLDELQQRYDIVMLDTPPVGLVTDGELVMRRADIPLYIVRLGKSKREYSGEINYLYEQKGIKKLSLILNGASGKSSYGYGNYGYGYGGYGYGGYGYGYGYYDEDQSNISWWKKIFKKK